MSRFEKFQRIQVLSEKNEPLTDQICISDCMINFENGYISNWYNDSEGEIYPAIDCIDAHIEYWENGVLNRDNKPVASSASENEIKPAVLSAGDNKIEFWENGKLMGDGKYYPNCSIEENKKVGKEAENNFAKYLNENNIDFFHLDQSPKELFSKILRDKNIKRPDYIIFLDGNPLFIDVKAKDTDCYTLNNDELERLNILKNEYSIDVIFAIIDRDKIESNNYSFLTLDTMTNYAEINKSKLQNRDKGIYSIPKTLLNTEMVFNKIDSDELLKIFCDKRRQYIKKYIIIAMLYKNTLKLKIINGAGCLTLTPGQHQNLSQ
jgi:hypothetical protein